MFDVAEASPITIAPIETKGKYIFEVADDIRRQLRSAGVSRNAQRQQFHG